MRSEDGAGVKVMLKVAAEEMNKYMGMFLVMQVEYKLCRCQHSVKVYSKKGEKFQLDYETATFSFG